MLWLLSGCVGARLSGLWIANELNENGTILEGPHLMDVTATEGGVFANAKLSDGRTFGCQKISRDAGDYLFHSCLGAERLRCDPSRGRRELDCADDSDPDKLEIEWLFVCSAGDPGCGSAEAGLFLEDTGALE